LNKIVDGISKAAALVGDITSASNEQATGITQINQAISQVAEVVQTNSSTAEESASASEELSSQAELMKNAVSRFKLKNVKGTNFENGLSSDVVRMIENMVESKKSHTSNNKAETESSSKLKISLDGKDFGKY
jgi:methyl-accepting chemotaxis protein